MLKAWRPQPVIARRPESGPNRVDRELETLDQRLTRLSFSFAMKIVITAPSLDEHKNVSGISTIVRQIIEHSPHEFSHFKAGREDGEPAKHPGRMLAIYQR